MKSNVVELVLNCSSWQEAQLISDAVLEKNLVDHVESIPGKTKTWLKKELEGSDGVKLIMQSVTANFDKIEAVVRSLHSQEMPNLLAVQVGGVTEKISEPLNLKTRVE